MTPLSRCQTWRFYTPIDAIGENRQVCPFPLIAVNRQPDRMGYFIKLLFKIVDRSDKMELGNKLELPHRRDRRKKSPSVSASIGGDFRFRSNSPQSANKIA